MIFYLGTHRTSQPWWDLGVPLFISRRRLAERKSLLEARAPWALDSGGFTELSAGEWKTSARTYIGEVRRFQQIGQLEWVAPQDYMCEPQILARTGLTVAEHQRRTVENFLRLRDELGLLVVPVLQGWVRDDYLRCWELYDRHLSLECERLVGLGTICRRQATGEAARIVGSLAPPLRLHGFGVKLTGLARFGHLLASADSLAWSYRGRRSKPLPGCTHANCANCIRFAGLWRQRVIREQEARECQPVAA